MVNLTMTLFKTYFKTQLTVILSRLQHMYSVYNKINAGVSKDLALFPTHMLRLSAIYFYFYQRNQAGGLSMTPSFFNFVQI